MSRCLICYRELTVGEQDYHKECADGLFGDGGAIVRSVEELLEEAKRDEVRRTIPLSIFEQSPLVADEVDGEWRGFDIDPDEGVVADLTMRLAEVAHIVTTPHGLVRTTDGELRIATRRVDQTNMGVQCPMESAYQISELSYEERYEGEYEEVATMVEECSSVGRIDVINLWERVVFAWICGYSEFNLARIALYEPYVGLCSLAPLSFATSNGLTDISKRGAMALGINNKRVGITRSDLECAMRNSGLKGRAINLIFKKFTSVRDQWVELIEGSLLGDGERVLYCAMIDKSLQQLAPKE